MFKQTIFFILAILVPSMSAAQFSESYSSQVRSLQMVLNDKADNAPVIILGSDDEICFSFDELSHTYHRYTYRIVHCNADWSPSELFTIDYIDGFNDRLIEYWQNSESTLQLYTHYEFYLPNEDVAFKVSGNYKVEVYDDAYESTPVAVFGFIVAEQRVRIDAWVSGNTDVDLNNTHQQVSFRIEHSGYDIQSPATDLKVSVMQNGRLDNMVSEIKPTYIMAGELQYVHNERLIFDAGNEFRRFELTDPHSPGIGVERVEYYEPLYHADLYADRPQRSHYNMRDENGRFFVNTLEGYGRSIEADYALVHFTLDAPYRGGGHYYLAGDAWGNRFSDKNIMLYDNALGAYTSTQLLKFGLYNYRYLWLPDDSLRAETAVAEGDWFNTENEYIILVYHRSFGQRYDRVVGIGRVRYK